MKVLLTLHVVTFIFQLPRDINTVHASAFAFVQPHSSAKTINPSSSSLRITPKSDKLSRPERKAQERKKKEKENASDQTENKTLNNRRKHNYKQREFFLSSNKVKNEGPYDLHSNHVSKLNSESTANDVLTAIKRAQNLHDVHDLRKIERFLLEEVDESFAFGYRGSILARLAVAALHLKNHELARRAIDFRRMHYRLSILPMESAAIIRGLLRVHNVTDAINLLDDELSLPMQDAALDSPEIRERLKYRALSIASIISRHFFEGEPSMSVKACQRLFEMGPIVQKSGLSARDLDIPWVRLIKGAAHCEAGRRNGTVIPCLPEVPIPSNLAYSVLNAMISLPSDNSDEVYEALSNALVRRSVFVTGAVTMDGCPVADRGEVVFIGRSNVGKSSLVNMVTNRKSLAYTSKRPGKTQQFNFFAINDKHGKEKEIKFGDVISGEKDSDSFYLVDVPGFGFAEVPGALRREWSEFLEMYISSRSTLKVVFHLVDSRHGASSEDAEIMRQMGQRLSKNAKYVVVLTKADKNVKGLGNSNGAGAGNVSRDVLEKVRATMKAEGVGYAPVVLTSAETKLGRETLWSYLRLAADTPKV